MKTYFANSSENRDQANEHMKRKREIPIMSNYCSIKRQKKDELARMETNQELDHKVTKGNQLDATKLIAMFHKMLATFILY